MKNLTPESYRKLKLLVFILILVFYGTLLVHKISLPAASDLGRHIKNGEMILQGQFDVLYYNFYSYTEPNFPFVNHHWLSGVIFFLINKISGFTGLVIFKTVILLSAFALLFFTSLKKANFWLVALFSIPTILLLRERPDIRPEIFSYLFISVFLYFLTDLEQNLGRKRILWLIPLQVLWVNLHILFIAGPILSGGFLLEKILLNYKNLKQDQLVRRLAVIFAVLIAVCVVNPNGVKGALAPLEIFNNYGLNLTENRSIPIFVKTEGQSADISVQLYISLAVIFASSFVFNFRKKPVFYFLTGLGGGLSGYLLVRNLPLFSFIFLPGVTSNLNTIFARGTDWLIKKHLNLSKLLSSGLMAVLPVSLVYLSILGVQGKISKDEKPGFGLTPRAEEAALFFKEHNLHGPIFNDYDIGNYLDYELFPQEKVFIDNRPEAYSADFVKNTYLASLSSERKWHETEVKYNFNVIFFYHYDQEPHLRQFLWNRMKDQNWALVYADTYNVIFVKNISANKNVIQKFRITRDNVGERLSYLTESPNPDDQIAAGDLFNLINREDLGIETFKNVVAKRPDKSKVWLIMGEWGLWKNDPSSIALAVVYLNNAIYWGEKSAEAYTYLGWAYYRLDRVEDAKDVFQKALKINPSYQNAVKGLEALKNLNL